MKKKRTNKLILGIDADPTKIGLTLIDYRKGNIVRSEVIKTKLKHFARTIDLINRFDHIIYMYPDSIVLAVIEDYGYYQQQRLAAYKGELIGLIKSSLLRHNVPFMKWLSVVVKGRTNKKTFSTECMVPPTHLKMFIFSTGRVSAKGKSSALMLEVFKQTGWEFSNDDMADSFMLAQMGRVYHMMKNNKFDNDKHYIMIPDGSKKKWKYNKKQLEPIEKWVKNDNY